MPRGVRLSSSGNHSVSAGVGSGAGGGEGSRYGAPLVGVGWFDRFHHILRMYRARCSQSRRAPALAVKLLRGVQARGCSVALGEERVGVCALGGDRPPRPIPSDGLVDAG